VVLRGGGFSPPLRRSVILWLRLPIGNGLWRPIVYSGTDRMLVVQPFQELFNLYLQSYNEEEEEIKPLFKFQSWRKD
jgi:hypothetical protein